MSETVKVGFSAPGSVTITVDDPTDQREVMNKFKEQIENMEPDEFAELVETDGSWLTENMHYVDSLDGEVYHEW